MNNRKKDQRKKWHVVSLFVVACVIISMLSFHSASAESTEMGGAVQTNGEIVFFEEKTAPSTSEPVPKPSPKGKLPTTGELMKKSLSITGVTLIIIIVFFYMKRNKERAGKETKQ